MRFELNQVERWKEEGNELFSKKEYEKAKMKYKQALDCVDWPKEHNRLKSILLTNRVRCSLEGEEKSKWNENQMEMDLSFAIALDPSYSKAYYRRSQLYQHQNHLEKAFEDLRRVNQLEPNDKSIQTQLSNLIQTMKSKKSNTLSVDNPLSIIQFISNTLHQQLNDNDRSEIKKWQEKMEEAMVKLVMASKEKSKQTSSLIFGEKLGLKSIFDIAFNKVDNLRELEKEDTLKIKVAAFKLLQFLSLVDSSQFLTSSCSILGDNLNRNDYDQLLETMENYEEELQRSVISFVTNMVIISNGSASEASDQVFGGEKRKSETVSTLMKLLSRYFIKKDSQMVLFIIHDLLRLPWTPQDVRSFLSEHLETLLQLSGHIQFRQVNSLFLAKLMSSMNEEIIVYFKNKFSDIISGWMKNRKDISVCIKGLGALSSVMLSDLDIGTEIFLKEIQSVAECLDYLQTITEDSNTKEEGEIAKSIMSEILAQASGNKKFQKVCEPQLMEEFLTFLLSDRLEIRAKIVATTCRLASGNQKMYDVIVSKDNGKKTLDEITKLLTCKKASKEESSIVDQWAIEALSFLTLHAPVKEQFVDTPSLVERIIEIGKEGEKELWYGIISIVHNVTRFLEKDDEVKQLTEQLQSFANGNREVKKLEIDKLDKDEFVNTRCGKMVSKGAVALLVQMTKEIAHSSSNDIKPIEKKDFPATEQTREAIASAFNSLATHQKTRGRMVADGAVKALLSLYEISQSEKVKSISGHALAKIAIAIDPNLGYSDGIVSRLVNPIMSLLRGSHEEGLSQWEALMALTNLALVREETSQLILKENGYRCIEMCQYSSNPLIQRAASELLCNLTLCESIFSSYRVEVDNIPEHIERRLKIWGGLSLSEDLPTARAASGVIAILSQDPDIVPVIIKIIKMEDIVEIAHHQDSQMQHRGAEILNNLIHTNKEIAKACVECGAKRALERLGRSNSTEAKSISSLSVAKLKEYKLY